jgi:hypothetical protein
MAMAAAAEDAVRGRCPAKNSVSLTADVTDEGPN